MDHPCYSHLRGEVQLFLYNSIGKFIWDQIMGIRDGKGVDLHLYDIPDTTLTPLCWMRSATRRIGIRPSARTAGRGVQQNVQPATTTANPYPFHNATVREKGAWHPAG